MSTSNLLKNRRIGVAVTGSIAIYKTLELIRLFVKSGAHVRVVMSKSAEKFIAPLTFETISTHLVLTDENESWAEEIEGRNHNHIGFAKWAEAFVVAPATANTIAKLANGLADNLLAQTLLAHKGTKIIAPSANTAMLEHPITKANLKMLGICGYEIVEPSTKLLACGDEGKGAMAEINDIFWQCARALLREEFYEYRNVVISGGGSVEKIDDVRYIGNFSSGKMANALALALFTKGADVTLVSSKPSNTLPSQIRQVEVSSGDDFKNTLQSEMDLAQKHKMTKPSLLHSSQVMSVSKEPMLFMAAAIADYKPKTKHSGKLKKENIGESLNLELAQTEDIISALQKSGIKVIGFKAEYDEKTAKTSAEKMLKEKKLSAVCLNILSDEIGFGSDDNEVLFVAQNSTALIAKSDKLDVAFQISELAQSL